MNTVKQCLFLSQRTVASWFNLSVSIRGLLGLAAVFMMGQVPIIGEAGLDQECKRFRIPEDKSYKLSNVRFSCQASAKSVYSRTEQKIPEKWFEWMASGSPSAPQRMYEIRREIPAPSWKATVKVPIHIEWTWSEKFHKEDASRCGTRVVSATCQRSVYKRVCHRHFHDDDTGSMGGGSWSGGSSSSSRGGGGGFGSSSGSGGSGRSDYEKRKTRYDSNPHNLNLDRFKFLPAEKRTNIAEQMLDAVIPQVLAHEDCEKVFSHYEDYSCDKVVPKKCHFEVENREYELCTEKTVAYQVDFLKPDKTNWNPSVAGYDGLRPMKYDLLPREYENVGLQFVGDGPTIQVKPIHENSWNKYSYNVSQTALNCDLETSPRVQLSITTEDRIKRRPPLSFVVPTQQDALNFPQVGVSKKSNYGNSKFIEGRPYQINLQNLNEAVMQVAASAKLLSKNTMLQIQLAIESDTQVDGEPVRFESFTNPVVLNGERFLRNLDNIRVPLDFDGFSEKTIYQPKGKPLFLGAFFDDLSWWNLQLIPGKRYRVVVGISQQGLSYYESGCPVGQLTCSNPDFRKVGEPLVVEFVATDEADLRDPVQKWIDWHRNNPLRRLYLKIFGGG